MIRGADSALVERAIASGEPFPGTRGFAGSLSDGRLVRDVLGRVPLSVDGPLETWSPDDDWAFDPTTFDEPRLVPAGTVVDANGPVEHWPFPDPEPSAETDALAALRAAVSTAVSAVETAGLAVAFSGGVDSALLAAALDAPLYTVGFPDGHDVATAREVADALGTTTTVRELTVDELEAAVPRVARAIDSSNAMDVQIALSLYFVADAAARDGFERLALGQGADELFGGYSKIEAVDHRVDAETVRGARREVLTDLPSGLARDTLALRAGGVKPVFSLLHDAVVEAGLRLPSSLVVADGTRKRGFRKVARQWVPASVADRPKKAMQYGSLVARELDRLARQAGFKRRMDDHVQKYVEARLDGADL